MHVVLYTITALIGILVFAIVLSLRINLNQSLKLLSNQMQYLLQRKMSESVSFEMFKNGHLKWLSMQLITARHWLEEEFAVTITIENEKFPK